MNIKKLGRNVSSSLVYEGCAVICNFILPRAILGAYGSDVNGLVSSITQFLSVISLLELGVGAVIQSVLYKPLADGDAVQVSKVMVSGNRFFKKLAFLFLGYVVALLFVYPQIVENDFGWAYTAVLIIAMAISSFAQYYFGISQRILLSADQKGFISNNSQTISLICNTLACLLLIHFGVSVQVVKFTTSLIFVLRIVYLSRYVNKHYSINWHINYNEEPIKQKWNGIAQHISNVVQNGIDVIYLSLLSTLGNVSVYSVYNLVASGLKTIMNALTSGVIQMMGELWVKGEEKELIKFFSWVNWGINTLATVIFSIAIVMILPFVQVYTLGVVDVDYRQPQFAMVLLLSAYAYCIYLPNNMLILAAGQFKQTQKYHFIATGIKAFLALILLLLFENDLLAIACATLITSIYQIAWVIMYNANELCHLPIRLFIKQYYVDAFTLVITLTLCQRINMISVGWIQWISMAVLVFVIATIISVVINLAFYRLNIKYLVVKAMGFIKDK